MRHRAAYHGHSRIQLVLAMQNDSVRYGYAPVGRFQGSGILSALGGACGLIVVLGVGRFAYTALLPGMMEIHGFGEDVAGIMASWNYAGYLTGVLAMRGQLPGVRRYAMLVLYLLVSLLTTAGMAVTDIHWLWHTIRFFSGVASGAGFVLCSAIVFDTLAVVNRPVLAGLLYSGTGTGIALSGIATGPLVLLMGQQHAWLGMALLCLPLAIVSCITLRPGVNSAPAMTIPASGTEASHKFGTMNGRYILLLLVYFLEGFGYIIGMTFIVAFVQVVTNSPESARATWVLTGLAAMLSAPVWRYLARKGYVTVLIFALVLQGVGVLLPVVSNTTTAAMIGGFLLGGTFMGIVAVAMQYATTISGKASANTVATMAAVYGIGQIIGPIIVAATAPAQGFSIAFVISSISLFFAAGLLLAGKFWEMKR